MKDFYYILGVEPNCTLDEIKEAYRKLSKKLHPDLNQGDKYFESRFRDIKEAFETLRDPKKRSRYDEAVKQPFSQDNAQKPQGQHYQTRRSDFSKFKRKGPGIGMKITLILIVVILGVYLFRYFAVSKAPPVTRIYADNSVAVPVHKKHKRKHSLRSKIASDAFKRNADSTGKASVSPALVKSSPVKPALIRPQPKSIPDSNKNIHHSGDFLYATYVRPNVTGVINMRAYDKFNSTIVETIPARSKVLVLEKGNTYYRVFFNNYIGYVPKWSLLTK